MGLGPQVVSRKRNMDGEAGIVSGVGESGFQVKKKYCSFLIN